MNKLVFGNWKLYGDSEKLKSFVLKLKSNIDPKVLANCALFPPAIYLP